MIVALGKVRKDVDKQLQEIGVKMPNIFPTESFSLKEYHRIPDDLKEN